jgi:hypothetical protein
MKAAHITAIVGGDLEDVLLWSPYISGNGQIGKA